MGDARVVQKLILTVVAILYGTVFAQASDGDKTGSNTNFEIGAHIGNLLPSDIAGLTEITGLGGFRLGYRLGPMVVSEATVAMGNGDGASYRNASLGLRFDVPVESFVGFLFIGADVTNYSGVGRASSTLGGGDVGGGIMTELGGALWLRSDMKFTFNPGTSMYIDFSFLFRI